MEVKEFINHINTQNIFDFNNILTKLNELDFNLLEFCEQCIKVLIEINFTGPQAVIRNESQIGSDKIKDIYAVDKEFTKIIEEALTCEGEVPFRNCRGLVLIWIVKNISLHIRNFSSDKLLVAKSCLIFLQSVYIHQETLQDERSPTLKDEMIACFEQFKSINDSEDKDFIVLEFEVKILVSYLYLFYYDISEAKILLNELKDLLGLKSDLRGAEGRRTKFQTFDLAQLYYYIIQESKVKSDIIKEEFSGKYSSRLPNDVAADDDLILEQIKYNGNDEDAVREVTLSLPEQSVLLLEAHIHYNSFAKDISLIEEVDCMLRKILGCSEKRNSTWSIVTDALLLRSKLKNDSSRQAERSLNQIEELSDQYHKEYPIAEERGKSFFLSKMPSAWKLQLHYSEICLDLNMVKTVMDLLLRWEQWPTYIKCLMRLNLISKARELIIKEIDKYGETVELLCCLGEVNNDNECFIKAWKLSKERSARAMKCLGYSLLKEQKLQEAYDAFKNSVTINSMQANVWMSMGFCALVLEQYRNAAIAYKHCVFLDPDILDNWNNAGNAYLKIGDKESALHLFEQAVKVRHNSWHVWSNVCLVSADLGYYQKTINSFRQIVQIRNYHDDFQSLNMIIDAIENPQEYDAKQSDREVIERMLSSLFDEIARTSGKIPMIWNVNARFLQKICLPKAKSVAEAKEIMNKIIKCSIQTYNSFAGKDWKLDEVNRRNVLQAVIQLANRSLAFNVDEKHTSAKLIVDSTLHYMDMLKEDNLQTFDEVTESMIEALQGHKKEIDEANK